MKKITVVIRNLPLNTGRNAEALRMSVGMTLRENRVTVIFIDDGVYTATPIRPEIVHLKPSHREFEALSMLKCPLLADKPSLEQRKITDLLPGVKTAKREDVVRTITDSDIVIPF